jgi:hypothetical protein
VCVSILKNIDKITENDITTHQKKSLPVAVAAKEGY